MKRLLLMATCLMLSICVSAQGTLATKIQNEAVVAGYVIVDGQKIDGYIKKLPNWSRDDFKYQPYWEQQELIRFMEKTKFETAPKYKYEDYTEYQPKTCDGFMYGDIEFCTVKYIDGSSVTGVVPKKIFLRKLGGNDKVTFFLHYKKIPAIQINGVNALSKDDLKKLVENPNLVYLLAGQDKAKGVEFINEKKDFSGCPKIAEKIASGAYNAERSADADRELTGYDGTFKRDGENMVRNLNIMEDVKNGVCQ